MTDSSLTNVVRKTLDDLDRLRPHIEAALGYADGTHTFDDITGMVLRGRLRFWPMLNSVMLTEILEYPREKHYHMFLGGGDLTEILAMHPEVEQAARDAGCCKLTIAGRRWWVKPLANHGWHEQHTVCVKRI